MAWHPGDYHEDLHSLAFGETSWLVLRCLWQPWSPHYSAPFCLQQIAAGGGLDSPSWEVWRAHCRRTLWAGVARQEDA